MNLSQVRETQGAVFLKDIIRPLTFYARALSGKKLRLSPLNHLYQSSRGYRSRPTFADGEQIFLPEVWQEFLAPSMNFLSFKLSTACQFGFSEFGTYAFQLSFFRDLVPPEIFLACLQSISSQRRAVSPLEIFFRLFPDRDLARDLFQVLEGLRIDHCLGRTYRGLKKEMDDYCQAAVVVKLRRPDFPRGKVIFDLMKKSASFCQIVSSLPKSLLDRFKEFNPLLTPLFERQATVEDTARATVTLYEMISSNPIYQLKKDPDESRFGLKAALNDIPFNQKYLDYPWTDLPTGVEDNHLAALPIHRLPLELIQRKLTFQDLQTLLNHLKTASPQPLTISGEQLPEMETDPPTFSERAPLLLPQRNTGGFTYRMGPSVRNPGLGFFKKTEKSPGPQTPLPIERENPGKVYSYDEWNYRTGDYLPDWCLVQEKSPMPGSSDFVAKALESYAGLVAEVRRQFQMLRPEYLKKIHHCEKGEEIDLNAAIEAVIDYHSGHPLSDKIYVEKLKKDRDFSTLFLLDISASTDERADGTSGPPLISPGTSDDRVIIPRFLEAEEIRPAIPSGPESKRVIDVEKEALVVMAEALREIGDDYAIFGFSSNGRLAVEFYVIKDFDEDYNEEVKRRIDGINPLHSTRMGPALRHSLFKISGRAAKIKTIILISDGYPQDRDYGEDRQDRDYGLYDTRAALQEVKGHNIHSFSITVDLAGNDYLRKICTESEYLVIEEVADLPRVLPKIYRRLTT